MISSPQSPPYEPPPPAYTRSPRNGEVVLHVYTWPTPPNYRPRELERSIARSPERSPEGFPNSPESSLTRSLERSLDPTTPGFDDFMNMTRRSAYARTSRRSQRYRLERPLTIWTPPFPPPRQTQQRVLEIQVDQVQLSAPHSGPRPRPEPALEEQLHQEQGSGAAMQSVVRRIPWYRDQRNRGLVHALLIVVVSSVLLLGGVLPMVITSAHHR